MNATCEAEMSKQNTVFIVPEGIKGDHPLQIPSGGRILFQGIGPNRATEIAAKWYPESKMKPEREED